LLFDSKTPFANDFFIFMILFYLISFRRNATASPHIFPCTQYPPPPAPGGHRRAPWAAGEVPRGPGFAPGPRPNPIHPMAAFISRSRAICHCKPRQWGGDPSRPQGPCSGPRGHRPRLSSTPPRCRPPPAASSSFLDQSGPRAPARTLGSGTRAIKALVAGGRRPLAAQP